MASGGTCFIRSLVALCTTFCLASRRKAAAWARFAKITYKVNCQPVYRRVGAKHTILGKPDTPFISFTLHAITSFNDKQWFFDVWSFPGKTGWLGASQESFVLHRRWPKGKFAVIILLSNSVDNHFSNYSSFQRVGCIPPCRPWRRGTGSGWHKERSVPS